MESKPHVIRTLRIPSTLDLGLQKLAQERNSSVNALAENALTRFFEFDRHEDELDYTSIPRALLVKAFDYLSDDEVRDLGLRSDSVSMIEFVLLYHQEADLYAILNAYQMRAKYTGAFKFHHSSEGRYHTILLNHNMGVKWSVFFEASLREVFHKLLGIELKTEPSANFVIGRFTLDSRC